MAAVLDPSRFTTVYCPFLDKNNINTYSPTALSNVAFSSLSVGALPVHENLRPLFIDLLIVGTAGALVINNSLRGI